jgi:hypothetical protein
LDLARKLEHIRHGVSDMVRGHDNIAAAGQISAEVSGLAAVPGQSARPMSAWMTMARSRRPRSSSKPAMYVTIASESLPAEELISITS